MFSKVSSKVRFMAATACVALFGGAAMGQAEPPDLPAITFPIDTASVVTAIIAAATAILLLVIGPRVAFQFVWSLVRGLMKSGKTSG